MGAWKDVFGAVEVGWHVPLFVWAASVNHSVCPVWLCFYRVLELVGLPVSVTPGRLLYDFAS